MKSNAGEEDTISSFHGRSYRNNTFSELVRIVLEINLANTTLDEAFQQQEGKTTENNSIAN